MKSLELGLDTLVVVMFTFMSNKIPLSVIIILNKKAANEVLPQVIDSLARAEQIITFDAGEKPIKDFSKVRNEALLEAKHEYVLFVDSDEVLVKKSWSEIEKIVELGQADLVSIVRSDIFHGQELRGGEAANQRLVRMGKKNKMKFIRSVHEVIEVDNGHNLLLSEIKILHHSHLNVSSFFLKVAFYSRIEAMLRKESDQVYLLTSMLFFPPLKFLWNMTVMRGYKDGVRGMVYAILMSLHSFFVRVHGWELRQQKVVR